MLTTNNNRFENENEQWWEKIVFAIFVSKYYSSDTKRRQNERASVQWWWINDEYWNVQRHMTHEKIQISIPSDFFVLFWLWSSQVWMNREYHVMIRNKRLIVCMCVCVCVYHFHFVTTYQYELWICTLFFLILGIVFDFFFFVWQRRWLFAWLCNFNA